MGRPAERNGFAEPRDRTMLSALGLKQSGIGARGVLARPGQFTRLRCTSFRPCLAPRPGVADLFKDVSDGGETWWLVVTPSCDLEHDKADHVILAAVNS